MHQSLDAAASTTSSSSSPLAAFHAAVLDLAGLLERPLAHGAPASVAVKPHHSHHHSAPSTSAASSGSDDDDRRGSSSGGRADDFEGLNFAQVRVQFMTLCCSPYAIRSQKKSQ